VKTYGESNQVKITTPYKVDVEDEVDVEIQINYTNTSKNYYTDGMSKDAYTLGVPNEELSGMIANLLK